MTLNGSRWRKLVTVSVPAFAAAGRGASMIFSDAATHQSRFV